jgi:glucose/arabinose dehydrogenase
MRHIATALVQRWALVLCGMAAACGNSAPPPPIVVPGPVESINGTERIGWTQPAADAGELATFHYALYVDGSRFELNGAECAHASTRAEFSCAAPLPPLTAGTHSLELATFTVADPVLESARSPSLRVTVAAHAPAVARAPAAWPVGLSITTSDRVKLRLEQLTGDFVDPTDFAFLPDGRVLVAERSGRIQAVLDGRARPRPALASSDTDQVLALAVDPQFDRTHFVYGLVRERWAAGPVFCVVRFREANNALVDRIVVLDGIPAAASGASAALRFGVDGKLFAAFDDAGDPSVAGDLASRRGKVLRLNPDGTTPADQAAGTPVYSYPHRSPRGLDWHATSHALWIADGDVAGSGRLTVVVSETPRIRGAISATLTLPRGTVPSSMAFYRGGLIPSFRDDLLIASDEGRHLLRMRIDPRDPNRGVPIERLLLDSIGGIRVVGVTPGGTIYVGTAGAVGKLSPVTP